ncbi:MAG: 23S rRNA (uracil(1939)-C(5))-methyltransferase RlmD [Neisseriaceae bacterium]|nr:23S rRNA (uracil(1939)-C(5))-methyltransferase RlmD [Neisseriaceae bacterium]
MTNTITIESLDAEGRGVAHLDGKVCFVANALPSEVVTEWHITRNKKSFIEMEAIAIKKPSPIRVKPHCPHFGVCGGCSLQHIDLSAQVAMKQRVLEDAFRHIGKVTPQKILPAVYGLKAGYRFRARMSVKYVAKKGGVLVGFHEKASPFVADMRECPNLPRHISDLIVPLREMINKLSIRDKLPQIEWAVGARLTVMGFRIMADLTDNDKTLLRQFIDTHQTEKHPLQLWLQPGKPDTLAPFYPENMPVLSYRLPEFNLEMPYQPTEFTQVNHRVNEVMMSRAMALLQPAAGEKIADMFCGLGNFSLPIARSGAEVLGVEGSEALVARAKENAEFNGLSHLCTFAAANLFKQNEIDIQNWQKYNKWLIDPPRDGAFELLNSLSGSLKTPQKIVYVSCKPATLARDAEVLIAKGYSLKSAGVLNMFAHTSHVESIALFEKNIE